MSSQKSFKSPGIIHSRVTIITHIIDRISERGGQITSFLIAVAAVQICFELILRYIFNAPTTWGLDMTIYLCGTTYIMSGAYAEHLNAHIKVDVFYDRWSLGTQAILDLVITDMMILLFCGALTWQSADWFWEAIIQGTTSGTIWDPPIWPMRLVLLTGAFFMLLSGFGKFLHDLDVVIYNQKSEQVV